VSNQSQIGNKKPTNSGNKTNHFFGVSISVVTAIKIINKTTAPKITPIQRLFLDLNIIFSVN